MRMLGFVFVLSVIGLMLLAVSRNVDRTILASPNLDPSNVRATSIPADEAAFEKIQREDATGRFPFLVSTLCQRFLEAHPTSARRADVENILQRNQAKIAESERAVAADQNREAKRAP